MLQSSYKPMAGDLWASKAVTGNFKHPYKQGRVTIAGNPDMELHPKTLKSILKQADIEDISDG